MKKPEHIKEAQAIGKDSYYLLNYNQLPKNASVARQVDALKSDQRWQDNHNIEIQSQIDILIQEITDG